MVPRGLLSWTAAVLAILPISSAQECSGWARINQTEDVDRHLGDCTTYSGTIEISDRYQGALSFPNLKNLTGSIVARYNLTNPDRQRYNVTSLEAPNLVYVGEHIRLESFTQLTKLSLPKLEIVGGEVGIIDGGDEATVELPALTHAGAIWMGSDGDIASINLDSLRTVDGTLNLWPCRSCRHPRDPISLPSLKSAGRIDLSGAMSNISMPNLESVGRMVLIKGSYAEYLGVMKTPGLVISLFQIKPGYEFVFPKLAAVDGQLYVNADLTSIEFPALTHTNASIYIAPSYDRDLDLDLPLVSATSIQLTRNIKSLKLDSLKSFNNLTIHSRVNFPCDSFNKTLIENTHYLDKTNSTFLCTSVSDSSGLSTGAKIAIGVAVPVGVILIAVVAFFVWKRKQVAKRRSTGVVLNQREVGGSSVAMVGEGYEGGRAGTPPPAYEGPRTGEART